MHDPLSPSPGPPTSVQTRPQREGQSEGSLYYPCIHVSPLDPLDILCVRAADMDSRHAIAPLLLIIPAVADARRQRIPVQSRPEELLPVVAHQLEGVAVRLSIGALPLRSASGACIPTSSLMCVIETECGFIDFRVANYLNFLILQMFVVLSCLLLLLFTCLPVVVVVYQSIFSVGDG